MTLFSTLHHSFFCCDFLGKCKQLRKAVFCFALFFISNLTKCTDFFILAPAIKMSKFRSETLHITSIYLYHERDILFKNNAEASFVLTCFNILGWNFWMFCLELFYIIIYKYLSAILCLLTLPGGLLVPRDE